MILLSQRALGTSDADHDLFVDRNRELKRVDRALRLGLNVYVHGPPGIGRTSFLRQIQRGRPEARYARLHGFNTLTERLEEVERGLTDQRSLRREAPNQRDQWATAIEKFSGTTYKSVEDPYKHLQAAAVKLPDDPLPAMLVDDLDDKGIVEMFGRWRDRAWEVPIQWVVSGTSVSLDPPADTFFDVVVELERFDSEELQDLLRRRTAAGPPVQRDTLKSMSESALESISPCTPRRALSVLRDLYLSDDLDHEARRLEEIQKARSNLKPTAVKVLDALGERGPTHASDEQLLAEVGVTRSRVVQILAELEAQGMVAAERSGRRKLYRPNPTRSASTVPGSSAAPEAP
ncbi:MAG: MarR family transcriptional regulator [Acidimicrobiaceae bacterium]|nr:MarR family transcriptional regulator [Acidimicrobiia bacterium]MCY4492760.1 MarR family transcriptional regulator [Acidimicrobiaceae bacterium]